MVIFKYAESLSELILFFFRQRWMEMKPQYSLNELKKMYKSQRPRKENKKSDSNELIGDQPEGTKGNKNNVKSKWIEFCLCYCWKHFVFN